MRAAIDFGSGAVKIQMAVVDPAKNCIVGKPLLAKYTGLALTEDLAAQGGNRISEEMAQKAMDILSAYKEEGLAAAVQGGHLAVEFIGIATAVFRKAENGNALLQKFEEQLGIRFEILSQDEEGILGFLTAKAVFPEVQEPMLLAWDSGNGSFQMTIKQDVNYPVFKGPLGHGTVRVLLSKDIRNGPVLQGHEFGNPVLPEEAAKLVEKIHLLLPPVPVWLKDKLSSPGIVVATFGDGESIFALTARAHMHLKGCKEPVQEAILTLEDVQKVIDAYIGKNDGVFDAAGLHRKTLTCAVHLSALMRYFGMQSIHYKKSIGNTPGMLIAPQLWEGALVN